jgi:hypothetical protein
MNGQLLLTAGLDKSLRLFQIDGSRNPKVQTVFLEDMPIHTARFSGDGRQVIMSGRRRHFYVYDLGGYFCHQYDTVGKTGDTLEYEKSQSKYVASLPPGDNNLCNFESCGRLASMMPRTCCGVFLI